MTVGDLLDAVEGYRLRYQDEFKRADDNNYILGQYVMSAVACTMSKKAKYPKRPLTAEKTQRKRGFNLSDPRVAKALFGKGK